MKMRYVDRKPTGDGATIDALVIEKGDTFGEVAKLLDQNASMKVIYKHFDPVVQQKEPVRYWVMANHRPRCLTVSQIYDFMETGSYEEWPEYDGPDVYCA